ncbi:MAG: hypothetical protein DRO11_08460 [Methanobacteriota archaeon]|nr:MAG: hypothetical protein DRO11_08460 [Euryarchaeota archaeon]
MLYSIGTRDLEEMRGIGRQLPVVGICFGIFGLALAGMPPLSGFMSELFLYRAGVDVGGWGIIFTIIILVNVVFSLGYYIPAVNKVLFSRELSERSKKARKVPFVMLVPIVVMAGLTVLLGVMPKLGLSLVKPVVVELCTVVGCP